MKLYAINGQEAGRAFPFDPRLRDERLPIIFRFFVGSEMPEVREFGYTIPDRVSPKQLAEALRKIAAQIEEKEAD